MKTRHFLYSEVKSLNLSIFVGNLCFKLSLFSHHLFGVNSLGLESLCVLNLSHGDFRGLVFDLFFMEHN